jgi:hypothetical protein
MVGRPRDGEQQHSESTLGHSIAAPASRPRPDACISERGSAGECTNGRALDGARSVAVSADGKNAYAASRLSGAVAVLAREP